MSHRNVGILAGLIGLYLLLNRTSPTDQPDPPDDPDDGEEPGGENPPGEEVDYSDDLDGLRLYIQATYPNDSAIIGTDLAESLDAMKGTLT